MRAAIKTGRLKQSLTKAGRIRNAVEADAEWLRTTKADRVPLTGPTSPRRFEIDDDDEAPAATTSEPVGPAAPPPVNELAAARTRREAVNADLAEIELARQRGELVLARDVEAKLADAFLRVRTRLLGVTVRAREADPTISDEQHRLYEALIREALEELSDGGRP